MRGSVRRDSSPFGFSCDNQTTYTLESYCPQMARAGMKWIRGFPTFNVIEPSPGKFDWSAVDAMLAAAAKNKMAISGLFFYNVQWINSKGDSLPIDNLPAWSDYVARVVTHCRGSVKYWEVWNETPNFMGKGTAADYARTAVAAYDAAKAADPTCQVGLSIQSQNVNWLEQTIDAGARDHFDFIAVSIVTRFPTTAAGTPRRGPSPTLSSSANGASTSRSTRIAHSSASITSAV